MIIKSIHLDGFTATAEFTDDERKTNFVAEIDPKADRYAVSVGDSGKKAEIENYACIEDAAKSRYFNVLAHLEHMRREKWTFLPESVLLLIKDSTKEYSRGNGEHFARHTFMLEGVQRCVEIYQDFSSGNGPLNFSVENCEIGIIESYQNLEEAEASPYYPLMVDLLVYFKEKAVQHVND